MTSSSSSSFLASAEALKSYVQPQLDYLFTARPTAVNLGAATRRLTRLVDEGVKSGLEANVLADALIKEAHAVADEDLGRNKTMSKHGAEWLIKKTEEGGDTSAGLNLLTVCNTGSLATSVSTCRTSNINVLIIMVRVMELL